MTLIEPRSTADRVDVLSQAERREIATELTRRSSDVAHEWADRHRTYRRMAATVALSLDSWNDYTTRYLFPLLITLARGIRTNEQHFFTFMQLSGCASSTLTAAAATERNSRRCSRAM